MTARFWNISRNNEEKIFKYIMLKAENGIIVLPTILLIGGLIMEIGIAGAFISFFLSQSGLGVKMSADALAASRSGVQDALIKITRNKGFVSPTPYTITIASRSAQITVLGNTPSNNKTQITSLGTASIKRRQVQAIVNINSITGEVKIESINEIPL